MLQSPRDPNFQVADGYIIVKSKLVRLAVGATRGLTNSSEFRLPNLQVEAKRFADARRMRQYQLAVDQQTRLFARDIIFTMACDWYLYSYKR